MDVRSEVDALYRECGPFVRRVLLRYGKKIQEADQRNIEQRVWESILKRWQSAGRRDDLRGYLAETIKNAVHGHFRHKNTAIRDERKTSALVIEADSGPIDVNLVDEGELPCCAFERGRTVERIQAIARNLPPREAAIYARLMEDYDAVPKKDRDRVVLSMKKIMEIPARPRSVEHPDLVEGPSQCGRTVRRLRLDDSDEEEALPNAAE